MAQMAQMAQLCLASFCTLLSELAMLGQVSRQEAERPLQRLQPSVSSAEYQIVRHLLKGLYP
ncbi:MAG: hypothetical protein OXH96_07625 [Spirochaetaceae bacterium]|nr:hypothetical protein [Spirochaetaceae bacterium]